MHGLNVGPTSNPFSFIVFNNTLFNKKLLPVRYFPTNDIIPMFEYFRLNNNFLVSFGIINLPFSNITNGKAACSGGT